MRRDVHAPRGGGVPHGQRRIVRASDGRGVDGSMAPRVRVIGPRAQASSFLAWRMALSRVCRATVGSARGRESGQAGASVSPAWALLLSSALGCGGVPFSSDSTLGDGASSGATDAAETSPDGATATIVSVGDAGTGAALPSDATYAPAPVDSPSPTDAPADASACAPYAGQCTAPVHRWTASDMTGSWWCCL
jgi:hypothetical protein